MADTSSQYLYDFMHDVVADQHLTRTQAVVATPLERLDAGESDTLLLTAYRSDTQSARKPHQRYADSVLYAGGYLTSCFTKADVDTMLGQKPRFASFRWHEARLGFKPVKGERYYRFSVPLFTKGKDRAIVAIEDLCPGLCGTGKLVLFVREQGRWKSKASSFPWFH